MTRILFGLLICFVVVLSLSTPSEARSQVPYESPRMKLYVGEVKGDADLVKSVRAQLVDELAKRGVALVASEGEADAILTGVGVHRAATNLKFRTRSTVSIVIRGNVQLIARDGKRLWSSDVSSTRWAFSETASFAAVAASRVGRILLQMTPRTGVKSEKQASLDG